MLSPHLGAQTFLVFNGSNPYSDSTVTLGKISYPDANGNLTVMLEDSDPGYTAEKIYGWTGTRWKQIASGDFPNSYELGRYWNGTAFVPFPQREPAASPTP